MRNYAYLVFRDIFQEYESGKCVEGLREMCEKVVSLVIKLIFAATSHSPYRDDVENMREDKALSIRYMDEDLGETVVIFEKRRIELEKDETMKDYGGSDFRAIYWDDQLRKCMGEL